MCPDHVANAQCTYFPRTSSDQRSSHLHTSRTHREKYIRKKPLAHGDSVSQIPKARGPCILVNLVRVHSPEASS